jgi:DNA-binding response OmpR family regulator
VPTLKLLVVEDDPKIAAALRRGLEAEGFTVDTADNGDDGLWMAEESRYDVIILDIMLPRRNGFVVCRDLRRSGNTTPILMLTAKDGELDEAEGLDTGADDYLRKPFSFPVLLARVRSLQRRAGQRLLASIEVGTLRIDPVGRRVWSGGTEIDLTHREFDVLDHLARRAGQVVSKSDLIAGVWAFDFGGDPNIVEVYIGRLRRKLGGPPERTHRLTTVRGAGYRLDADG